MHCISIKGDSGAKFGRAETCRVVFKEREVNVDERAFRKAIKLCLQTACTLLFRQGRHMVFNRDV